MSLAEVLCLGCWLQGLPGESHMPETGEMQKMDMEDQPKPSQITPSAPTHQSQAMTMAPTGHFQQEVVQMSHGEEP